MFINLKQVGKALALMSSSEAGRDRDNHTQGLALWTRREEGEEDLGWGCV